MRGRSLTRFSHRSLYICSVWRDRETLSILLPFYHYDTRCCRLRQESLSIRDSDCPSFFLLSPSFWGVKPSGFQNSRYCAFLWNAVWGVFVLFCMCLQCLYSWKKMRMESSITPRNDQQTTPATLTPHVDVTRTTERGIERISLHKTVLADQATTARATILQKREAKCETRWKSIYIIQRRRVCRVSHILSPRQEQLSPCSRAVLPVRLRGRRQSELRPKGRL